MTDVINKNLSSGEAIVSSVTAGSLQGNNDSGGGYASRDGTKLLFSSWATNFTSVNTNGKCQLYVKQLSNGELTLVSKSASGNPGNGNSADDVALMDISTDGKTIAFSSYASNLVSGDTNKRRDVFLVKLK